MGRNKQQPSEWNRIKRKYADDVDVVLPAPRRSRNERSDPMDAPDVARLDTGSIPRVTVPGLKSYEYSALQGPTWVRLLSLAPGIGDEVSCNIQHVDLDTAPEYEALSYVWGSPEKSCRLVVQQVSTGSSQTSPCQLNITASLYTALRDLRSADDKKERRILWADAVCINQDDIVERNIQVQMMGEIYRSASRVITYIGEKVDSLHPAIELATKLSKYADNHINDPPDDRLYDQSKLPELGFPPQVDPCWSALSDLMRRPWSSRVWIAQESVLNQNMVMVCGSISFKWSLLSDLALHRATPALPSLLPTVLGLEIMATLRRTFGELTLLQALRLCRQFSCSEPRDRVYALLNIAKDSKELDVTVDYATSVTDLYTSITAKIMLAESSLLPLSCISSDSTLPLPSWVPNWSSGRISDPLGARQCYAASKGTAASFFLDSDQKFLSVLGAKIDMIQYMTAEIAPELAFPDFDTGTQWEGSKQEKAGRKWLMEQTRQMKALPSMYDDPIDAFWRTLVGNVASDQKTEADHAYHAAFDAWLQMLYRLKKEGDELVDFGTEGSNQVENEPELLLEFLNALSGHWNDRSFCITTSGYFGLVPTNSSVGDSIIVLYGGRAPFILRHVSDHFVLVGDCYIHGLMKGEALKSGKLENERSFIIF